MNERIRLAILMGGQSAERDVSLHSGATVVRELLGRHDLKPVEILANGRWRFEPGFLGTGGAGKARAPGQGGGRETWFRGDGIPILEALSRLRGEGIDAVFNALHGPLGEDGTVQGLLRMLEIPFTGPDVIPAAVTMDKRLTKQVLASAGFSTPRFFTIRAPELRDGPVDWARWLDREGARVPFPWVLKPNRLGSSVGVAILKTPEEVMAEAQSILERWPEEAFRDDLLVEEAIRGRELTCGVIETDGCPRPLPPIEIRPLTSTFFDYHAKYTAGASEEVCPAPLSAAEEEAVQTTAVQVHRLFECAPLSRTDLFLTPSGALEVLEVNTLPGMTATSLIPLSASKAGLSLGDLLESLVEHGILRAAAVKRPIAHYNHRGPCQ
ncbi:MAG TPA: D-alanine--D-alanine ligase [Planctomycetota bacterium]|nr:D-alanine--D-alanine ligase [Planctomycetota bacterium]